MASDCTRVDTLSLKAGRQTCPALKLIQFGLEFEGRCVDLRGPLLTQSPVFGVKDVIDPRETRAYLIDTLDIHGARLKGGVGEHKLESWPTSFV